MENLATQLRIANYVTFTGRVSDARMLSMLNTADVCVNPDRANEMNDKSTMNKIMEYMILGKPIVQFDLKEGRFSARQASVYARRNDIHDFAARIVDLLEHPERREAMGEYGRKRVLETLAWHHQAPNLLAAYDRLWPTTVKQQHETSSS
jgi:glycosyltransferase involved in cell wall biosynthesis